MENNTSKSIAWAILQRYLKTISRRKSCNIYSFINNYCYSLNTISQERVLVLVRNDALDRIDIYHINNISTVYINYLKNTIHYFYKQRLKRIKDGKRRTKI